MCFVDRKEKKIFDPSDYEETPPRKTRKSSSRETTPQHNIVDVFNKTLEEALEPEVVIKQEAPDDLEDSLAIELDGAPTTAAVPYDEIVKPTETQSTKVVIKEEAVDIDELLKDCDEEARDDPAVAVKQEPNDSDGGISGPPRNIIQCPTCGKECVGLNCLKLHMDSIHGQHAEKMVKCPVCMQEMLGKTYEKHFLLYHKHYINSPNYDLRVAPKLVVRNSTFITSQKFSRITDPNDRRIRRTLPKLAAPPTIKFNIDNPWAELISCTARQKRLLDIQTLNKLLSDNPEAKQLSRGIEKETIYSPDAPKIFTNRPTYDRNNHLLNCKVDFVCGLELNSHFKSYLANLQQVKVRRRILEKFADKMTDEQILELEKRIDIQEDVLSTPPAPKPGTSTSLAQQTQNLNLKIITNNLIKKGVIKPGPANNKTHLKQVPKSMMNKKMTHLVIKNQGEKTIIPKKVLLPTSQLKANLAKMVQDGSMYKSGQSLVLKTYPSNTKVIKKPIVKEEIIDPIEEEAVDPLEDSDSSIKTEVNEDSILTNSKGGEESESKPITLNIPIEDILST